MITITVKCDKCGKENIDERKITIPSFKWNHKPGHTSSGSWDFMVYYGDSNFPDFDPENCIIKTRDTILCNTCLDKLLKKTNEIEKNRKDALDTFFRLDN